MDIVTNIAMCVKMDGLQSWRLNPVRKSISLFAFLALLLTMSITAPAQEALKAAAAGSGPNQSVVGSLSTLPEADALVYFNAQRIINEAIPKFLPEKDVVEMRRTFEEVKKNAGIDPSRVEYLVMAVRFRKPAADLSFMPPEFIAVAGGDFSADSLLTMARMAAGGRLRDQKHGSKTLGLMTIDPVVKEAEKNPILKTYAEVGIVSLNANTIAIGTTPYLKAAVDAAEGTGRISAESLNSLLRDPSALVSAAGSPWASFAKTFGLRGTEANARTSQCESQLGNFYVALNMDATNFMLRGSMNADNPDTAKIINHLISGLMAQASSLTSKAESTTDKAAQAALRQIKFAAEENEVVVRADVSQQMVLDFIKEQMAPQKQDATVTKSPAPVKKKTTVRRKRRT
ncbi:MAG: hypothetical protein ACRD6N_14020 [Pyrinomonadaceae bacterium]